VETEEAATGSEKGTGEKKKAAGVRGVSMFGYTRVEAETNLGGKGGGIKKWTRLVDREGT